MCAYYHQHLLGTGLVTAAGAAHKRQRLLVGAALRVDILEETAYVAKGAVDRLSARFEAARGTGKPVEIAEEFRVMTLQVIGELILSLSPEESARVFPKLYLPIVSVFSPRRFLPLLLFAIPPRRAIKQTTSERTTKQTNRQGFSFTFLIETLLIRRPGGIFHSSIRSRRRTSGCGNHGGRTCPHRLTGTTIAPSRRSTCTSRI